MGEVVFGGVGSGMYGMLLYVLIAVFVAGLMVGRTPEYLGRKIEAREIKLAMVGILVMPVGLLVLLSLAMVTDQGLASIFNAGPQGFAEAFYAYDSQFNNNGSAFDGLRRRPRSPPPSAAVAMLIGRFIPILAIMAIAGALSTQDDRPGHRGHPADHHADLRRDAPVRDRAGRGPELRAGAGAGTDRDPALGGELLMGHRILHLAGVAAGMIVVLTVITGIAYPLVMTGAARTRCSRRRPTAAWSGSTGRSSDHELAGQAFTSPAYFHTRPSATTPSDNPRPPPSPTSAPTPWP